VISCTEEKKGVFFFALNFRRAKKFNESHHLYLWVRDLTKEILHMPIPQMMGSLKLF